jgi:hypothetical protein
MGVFDFLKGNNEKKIIKLHNTAPNGMEIDIITLTEVPNADGSGIDWEITFKQMDFLDEELIGWCHPDDVRGVRFAGNSNLSSGGLKLLAKWLDENSNPA